MIKTTLVDRRNLSELLPQIQAAVAAAPFCGIDCETHDDNRHAGLNAAMKVDEETRKKAGNKRLMFDMRRTVMTGFSLFPEGHDQAYYFNLAHADILNTLDFAELRPILDGFKGFWLAHNAPYELTCFKLCHGYELKNVICTMQLSVSCFGDDNYDRDEFTMLDLGPMAKWQMTFMTGTDAQKDEALTKILAKESDAAHSYNGMVDRIAYGHGLKQLVKRFLGGDMMTFQEVMGDAAHMGQLMGEQVAHYGADDAYWVVPLFRKLMAHLARTSPNAVDTFFKQENPMIHEFSKLQIGGLRVNFENIEKRRNEERAGYATLLRRLRKAMQAFESFPEDPVPTLAAKQPWYAKNRDKYRTLWLWWTNLEDEPDDFEECRRVSSAVPNAWVEERGVAKGSFSITHYMPQRTLLYDMLRIPIIYDQGSIASDAEARGKMKQKTDDPKVIEVLDCLSEMTSLETRMKLYLTPYTQLTDPETNCLYPTVNSLLNTRRLAASTPNPMQLAKRGQSTYVRGFFLADDDDQLMVSIDWSAIELVIIGELSGDPEFARAFGQVPHEDLHSGAAVAVLNAEIPSLTEAQFKALSDFEEIEAAASAFGLNEKEATRLFTNLKGESLLPAKAKSYWRTEVGKGSNFNYWYSGFLTTVGDRMGWDLDKTGEATERYRARFAVAEAWRVDRIHQLNLNGFLELPDGHRRFRYEATSQWAEAFCNKWIDDPAVQEWARKAAGRIQRRAQNQGINALVQGTCATLMKRSILNMKPVLERFDAQFKIPIHDEMVFSVPKQNAAEFVFAAREVMLNHPELFSRLKIDASPSIGRTFEPYNKDKAPFGQIELFEPPAEFGLGRDRLDVKGVQAVVDYLSNSA